MTTKLLGYEHFMPFFVAVMVSKEKKDSDLSEGELKAIIALAFMRAVKKTAHDSRRYIVSVPIDLYRETNVYPIPIPEGFIFVDVNSIETNGYTFNGSISENVITLPCCPNCDIKKAWYVNVAVEPKISSGECKFDADFIERFFEPIAAHISYQLALQDARRWANLGKSERLLLEYKRQVRSLRRLNIIIRTRNESLIDDY